MSNLLYDEDCDHAYYAEMEEELAKRRALLLHQLGECEVIKEQLESEGKTPLLLARWNERIERLKSELAELN